MKRLLICASFLSVCNSAFAADVGVNVTIGQPGFYGRIEIGNYPQPVTLYAQPVVIAPAPVAVQPIYLRVPPGHTKNWAKHCAKYNACGQPVYFVRESWYQNVYVPSYRDRQDGGDNDRDEGDRKHEGKHQDRHKEKHKGKDKD